MKDSNRVGEMVVLTTNELLNRKSFKLTRKDIWNYLTTSYKIYFHIFNVAYYCIPQT